MVMPNQNEALRQALLVVHERGAVLTDEIRRDEKNLAEKRAELREVHEAAHALEKLMGVTIEQVTAANPCEPLAGDGPRGKYAVRQLLMEVGKPMRVADIARELTRRGWIENNHRVLSATRTNVDRAADTWRDQIVKVDRGVFAYVNDELKAALSGTLTLAGQALAAMNDDDSAEAEPSY
jgi:hypothetical protein